MAPLVKLNGDDGKTSVYIRVWVAVATFAITMFIHGTVAVGYLHSTFVSKENWQQVREDIKDLRELVIKLHTEERGYK